MQANYNRKKDLRVYNKPLVLLFFGTMLFSQPLSFGYDEHVWLSVKNAEVLSKAIADALEKADPDHKDIYQENASAYSEKLKDLDAKYQEVVDGASQKTLLFGDRFPFRYLVDDYGLSYYAALVR